jgi:arginine repressor
MSPAFGDNWTSYIEHITTKIYPHSIFQSNLLHFNFNQSNVTVYTVRGTATAIDSLIDLELWT